MALKNLNELEKIVQDKVFCVETGDIEIPESFKGKVSAFQEDTSIAYNRYTFIFTNAQGQKIFSPNHVFYIASCLVEVYDAVMEYKDTLESIFSAQWVKELTSKEYLTNYDTEVIDAVDSLSDNEKEWLKLFCNDYSWWNGGKSIGRNDFYVSPVLGTANVVAASNSLLGDLTKFLSENKEYNAILQDCLTMSYFSTPSEDLPENQVPQKIYFGSPGTGKSHSIDEDESFKGAEPENKFRTIFHPESDYSSFVGCYKPSMDGDKIVYTYTPQVFTKAYIQAWKCFLDADSPETVKPVFLIIEEINRGNCAQIFGDLFQLLDRDDAGFSKYAISADKDLAMYLSMDEGLKTNGKAFIADDNKLAKLADWETNNSKEAILNGTDLCLPPNLYIWATMNTSDQGLFPMDSAFKRRWLWEYMPIKNEGLNHKIEVSADEHYDWWTFIEKINKKIEAVSMSSDKKIGYWFCKPVGTEKNIGIKTFVTKVLSYLWNDVFKNVDRKFDKNVFKFDYDDKPFHSFDSFFISESGEIDNEMVKAFFAKLGVDSDEVIKAKADTDSSDDSASTESGATK